MQGECPRAPELAEAPDLPEELLLREDSRRVAQQLDQQLVLLAGERDGGAADGDAAGRQVSGDRTGVQRLVRARRRSPQNGPNPCEQLLVGERPREVVVAAPLESADTVNRVGFPLAENDHGNVSVPCSVLLERGGVAEQDEVRTGLLVDDLKAVVR